MYTLQKSGIIKMYTPVHWYTQLLKGFIKLVSIIKLTSQLPMASIKSISKHAWSATNSRRCNNNCYLVYLMLLIIVVNLNVLINWVVIY